MSTLPKWIQDKMNQWAHDNFTATRPDVMATCEALWSVLTEMSDEFDVDITRREIVKLCDTCSDHDVYIARYQHQIDTAKIVGLREELSELEKRNSNQEGIIDALQKKLDPKTNRLNKMIDALNKELDQERERSKKLVEALEDTEFMGFRIKADKNVSPDSLWVEYSDGSRQQVIKNLGLAEFEGDGS